MKRLVFCLVLDMHQKASCGAAWPSLSMMVMEHWLPIAVVQLGKKSQSQIFPKGFEPEAHIFNGHQIREGELILMRDPLEVMQATQSGIENVASFLTESINSRQLQMLAALMDEKACDCMHLV